MKSGSRLGFWMIGRCGHGAFEELHLLAQSGVHVFGVHGAQPEMTRR